MTAPLHISGQEGNQAAVSSSGHIERITLPHKPTARLAVRWFRAHASQEQPANHILVIFLNGLMTTLPSWTTVYDQCISDLPSSHNVTVLSYDRFGQGLSDPDPNDAGAEDPSHGHDAMASVSDLHHLIAEVTRTSTLSLSSVTPAK